MIAGPGGFQAEATFYVNGLDIDAKIEMLGNDGRASSHLDLRLRHREQACIVSQSACPESVKTRESSVLIRPRLNGDRAPVLLY